MWIQEQSYDETEDMVKVTVTSYSKRDGSLLAVTKGSHKGSPKAWLNGKEIVVSNRTDGALEVMIPAGTTNGSIILKG